METQVLANFIVECIVYDDNPKDELNSKSKQIETLEADLASVWVLYINGASNIYKVVEPVSSSPILKGS